MRLLDSDIKEYQRLHKKYFGTDISTSLARRKLTLLLHQMGQIYRPISKDQVMKITKEDIHKRDKDL